MAITALVLFGIYFAVAFGLRTWLQYRQTGNSGFRGLSGRIGSAEWWGGVLFVLALVAALAGPLADLAGWGTIHAFDLRWVNLVGVALTITGIAATFGAQVSMGVSWRVGVDATERTDLVTDGAFAIARNPVFTAMGLTGLGLVLVVPNVLALAGLGMLLVAVEMQVRGVEEPYLRSVHGDRWDDYRSRVGRFLPGLGTTSPRAKAAPASSG